MLTSKQIEEQISQYWLTPLKVRDDRVEFRMKIPYFMTAFNRYVKERNKIPSPDQFYAFYTSINYEFFQKIQGDIRAVIGIEARAKRAYPSMIRDVHLTALLKENGMDVVYDESMDVNEGVDQIINYKGQKFYVHCFVKTKRSESARNMKDGRHEFTGKHIDLPLDLDARDVNTNIGDFRLYSKKHIDALVKTMDSML